MVDIDGICDIHDPLERLLALKKAVPGLKVTAFLIPSRCSDKLKDNYFDQSEWLRVGMHGWRHTFGECYSWNPNEAEDKIMEGMASGFEEAFRAPNWITSPIIYEVCEKYKLVVADCKHWNCSIPTMPMIYRFDEPKVLMRPIHLNASEPIDEYVEHAIKTPGAKFSWISEVAWKA